MELGSAHAIDINPALYMQYTISLVGGCTWSDNGGNGATVLFVNQEVSMFTLLVSLVVLALFSIDVAGGIRAMMIPQLRPLYFNAFVLTVLGLLCGIYLMVVAIARLV